MSFETRYSGTFLPEAKRISNPCCRSRKELQLKKDVRKDQTGRTRFFCFGHGGFALLVALLCVTASPVLGIGISPGRYTPTMEWGTTNMISRHFTVSPGGTKTGTVSLRGPDDTWFSLKPDSLVQQRDVTWTSGWTNGYDVYITEPRTWVPNSGDSISVDLVASERADGGGATAAVGGQIDITLTNVPEDTIAPVTSASVSGLQSSSGMYKWDVRIEFQGCDGLSGVEHTYYRLDSGEPWQTGDEIVLTEPGNHTVEYYSADRAGNAENPQSLSLDMQKGLSVPVFTDSGTRVSAEDAWEAELGDINGDGLTDVVMVNWNPNNGSGTNAFLANTNRTFTDTNQSLWYLHLGTKGELGDLDQDSDLDLVLPNFNKERYGGGLFFFPNQGDGTFGGWRKIGFDNAEDVALADIDGDGKKDLITNNGLIMRNIDGGWPPYIMGDSQTVPVPIDDFIAHENRVSTGDIDGDGFPDIVTNYMILYNDGTGTFSLDRATALGGEQLFDMNSDGLLDLVSRSALYLNKGGSFEYRWFNGAGPFDVGDLNGDGLPDIVSQRKILLGVGGGYFRTVGELSVPKVSGDYLADISLADFDGDSRPDILGSWTCDAENWVVWNETGMEPIPEPATLCLLGIAVAPLLVLGRRRNAHSDR